jgi:hypothetical protein
MLWNQFHRFAYFIVDLQYLRGASFQMQLWSFFPESIVWDKFLNMTFHKNQSFFTIVVVSKLYVISLDNRGDSLTLGGNIQVTDFNRTWGTWRSCSNSAISTSWILIYLTPHSTRRCLAAFNTVYILVCRAKEFFQVVVHSRNWINLQRHHTTKLGIPFKKNPVKPHVQSFILTSRIKKSSCYIALYGDSNSLLIHGCKNCGCRLSRCIPL